MRSRPARVRTARSCTFSSLLRRARIVVRTTFRRSLGIIGQRSAAAFKINSCSVGSWSGGSTSRALRMAESSCRAKSVCGPLTRISLSKERIKTPRGRTSRGRFSSPESFSAFPDSPFPWMVGFGGSGPALGERGAGVLIVLGFRITVPASGNGAGSAGLCATTFRSSVRDFGLGRERGMIIFAMN